MLSGQDIQHCIGQQQRPVDAGQTHVKDVGHACLASHVGGLLQHRLDQRIRVDLALHDDLDAVIGNLGCGSIGDPVFADRIYLAKCRDVPAQLFGFRLHLLNRADQHRFDHTQFGRGPRHSPAQPACARRRPACVPASGPSRGPAGLAGRRPVRWKACLGLGSDGGRLSHTGKFRPAQYQIGLFPGVQSAVSGNFAEQPSPALDPGRGDTRNPQRGPDRRRHGVVDSGCRSRVPDPRRSARHAGWCRRSGSHRASPSRLRGTCPPASLRSPPRSRNSPRFQGDDRRCR